MLQKIEPQGAKDTSVSHPGSLLPAAHGEWSLEQTAPTTAFWKDSVQKGTQKQNNWGAARVARGSGSGCQGGRKAVGQHRRTHGQLSSMPIVKRSESAPACACQFVRPYPDVLHPSSRYIAVSAEIGLIR